MRIAHLFFGMVVVMATLSSSSARAGEGGGWVADFNVMRSDPAMKEYITHAHSELGGDCCVWADGFMLGKVYKFDRGKETTHKVVLYSWRAEPDGYHAVVWDYLITGDYVELIADYRASAPGNPTGTPIVWVRQKYGSQELEIRCYGGEPQG